MTLNGDAAQWALCTFVVRAWEFGESKKDFLNGSFVRVFDF